MLYGLNVENEKVLLFQEVQSFATLRALPSGEW